MPSTRTLATSLLPTDDGLRLDDVSIGPDQIVATLEATAPRSTCPVCGTWSETVHSLYQRTMADLPWGQQTVQLRLRVRKFFVTGSFWDRGDQSGSKWRLRGWRGSWCSRRHAGCRPVPPHAQP